MSRLASALVALGILAGLVVLALKIGVKLRGWPIVPLLVAWVALYLIAWTYIVRLKLWTPFQYWLPKSRVIGYAVYLAVPVATIFFVVFLAVHFEWGM